MFDTSSRLRRLGIGLLIVTLILAPIAPVMAASSPSAAGGVWFSDTLAPSALDRPDDAVGYGAGPGWSVKIDQNASNATGKLTDWADSSEQRFLVEEPGPGGWATVAAPSSEIGTGMVKRFQGAGLAGKSYIVAIEPAMGMGTPEVTQLAGESELSFKRLSLYSQLTGPGSLETLPDGVATSNESWRTHLDRSRDITGVANVSVTGSGVTAAVIDTGANTNDGAVFGNGTQGSALRILNNSRNFAGGANESVDIPAGDLEPIADGSGHGTHVASTIAANHSNATKDGMAPDANLLILKALGDDGSGSSADIAEAIRYAADRDADVISLSLGSAVYSEQIDDAVRYAVDQGSVVVVATGNSRQTVRWTASPSDTQTAGVLSVGAANAPENGTNASRPAYFSQQGPDPGTTDMSSGVTAGAGVDLVAPGMQVVAAVPTTSNTVRDTAKSGTSMATPHVSGGAVLLLAADSSLEDDPEAVEARLTNYTRAMPHASMSAAGDGYLAVDKAIDETDPSDQAAARTDAAVARDTAWERVSDASGGAIFDLQQQSGINIQVPGL